MKQKGFTLIELLAVIVVLAIIAIVAVPMILNVIEKSKEGSAVDSAYGYIHAIEQGVTLREIRDKVIVSNGEYTNLREFENENNITLKGEKPSNGTFTLEKRRVISAEFIINGYRVICDKKKCRTSGKADKITITYDLDGGTLSKSQDIIYKGDTLTLPVPEKTNYGFEGWYIGNIKVNNETVFTENVTLKAKYKKNRFTITFNAGDGTLVESSTMVNHNETIELPTPTAPTNYLFIGWYTESNGNGEKITNETLITGDMTLYAYYIKIATEFAYTGSEQTFTVKKSGKYKLETWGAQGGDSLNNYIGGYGGYSVGIVNLEKDTVLYVNVGGTGTNPTSAACNIKGGYNGGGSSNSCEGFSINSVRASSGGGATHIALDSGILSSLSSHATDGRILIVSGGGGGADYSYFSGSNYYKAYGGVGGGYIGGTTSGSSYYNAVGGSNHIVTTGGGQSQGSSVSQGERGHSAIVGGFGQGGNASRATEAGGGGGYYGGNAGKNWAAGGGSGYIGSASLISSNDITKHMTCYNCSTSSAENTKTISNTCVNSNPTNDCSKTGHGYAKITYIGE